MNDKLLCENCGREVCRKREMMPEIESYTHVGDSTGCLFPWPGTPKEEAMNDKYKQALEEIAEMSGMTILGRGESAEHAHEIGANKAFEQAASIAKKALEDKP